MPRGIALLGSEPLGIECLPGYRIARTRRRLPGTRHPLGPLIQCMHNRTESGKVPATSWGCATFAGVRTFAKRQAEELRAKNRAGG